MRWWPGRTFSGPALVPLLLLGACGGGEVLLGDVDAGDAAVADGGADGPSADDGHDAGAVDDTPWWTDVLGDVGAPGWADGTAPWIPELDDCPERRIDYLDVWSEPGVVYLSLQDTWSDEWGPGRRHRTWANRGGAWEELHGRSDCLAHPLEPCPQFVAGRIAAGLLEFSPGAALVRPGAFVALPELDGVGEGPGRAFVVNERLAYAVWEDKVVRWNGEAWSILPAVLPYPVRALWADEDELIAVGDAGTVVSLELGTWRLLDTGVLADFATIWGTGDGEIWIAARGLPGNPLVHFDGAAWTRRDWPTSDRGPLFGLCGEPGVEGIWGAGGVGPVYFHSQDAFFSWDGGRFTLLTDFASDRTWCNCGAGDSWYCAGALRVRGMWGNGPAEVFLAVGAADPGPDVCVEPLLLRWDGSSFHRM